jgi:hypothetical protein
MLAALCLTRALLREYGSGPDSWRFLRFLIDTRTDRVMVLDETTLESHAKATLALTGARTVEELGRDPAAYEHFVGGYLTVVPGGVERVVIGRSSLEAVVDGLRHTPQTLRKARTAIESFIQTGPIRPLPGIDYRIMQDEP